MIYAGTAQQAGPEVFVRAADRLGCEVNTLLALWEVEAAGMPFRADGTLERRYEPHKDPGHPITQWRDSLKMPQLEREAAFERRLREDPEAACRATSWGAPQIMGFNHEAAGYPSAMAMVAAFADDEAAQVAGFVRFIEAVGLTAALRLRDWGEIERRYNGGGQGGAYARKMAAAYRRLSGAPAPVVLRFGSSGRSVRGLQRALGITIDGSFGPKTLAAVEAFQRKAGLAVDGVVGPLTWAALDKPPAPPNREAPPEAAVPGLWRALIQALGAFLKAWKG